MIVVGQHYTTVWPLKHRIDCTIVELREDVVVADCDHRCHPWCYLLQDNASTLTLSGRRAFFYDQFATQFQLVPDGAIPLPPSSSLKGTL